MNGAAMDPKPTEHDVELPGMPDKPEDDYGMTVRTESIGSTYHETYGRVDLVEITVGSTTFKIHEVEGDRLRVAVEGLGIELLVAPWASNVVLLSGVKR